MSIPQRGRRGPQQTDESSQGLVPTGRPRARERWWLLALLLFTGFLALVGGALLMVAPDGSLLGEDPAALTDSPFATWRVPGLLLAVLVGGGFVFAWFWQWRDARHARALSMLAGLGLVAFEFVELVWVGLHPRVIGFAVVGVSIVLLAGRQKQP